MERETGIERLGALAPPPQLGNRTAPVGLDRHDVLKSVQKRKARGRATDTPFDLAFSSCLGPAVAPAQRIFRPVVTNSTTCLPTDWARSFKLSRSATENPVANGGG